MKNLFEAFKEKTKQSNKGLLAGMVMSTVIGAGIRYQHNAATEVKAGNDVAVTTKMDDNAEDLATLSFDGENEPLAVETSNTQKDETEENVKETTDVEEETTDVEEEKTTEVEEADLALATETDEKISLPHTGSDVEETEETVENTTTEPNRSENNSTKKNTTAPAQSSSQNSQPATSNNTNNADAKKAEAQRRAEKQARQAEAKAEAERQAAEQAARREAKAEAKAKAEAQAKAAEEAARKKAEAEAKAKAEAEREAANQLTPNGLFRNGKQVGSRRNNNVWNYNGSLDGLSYTTASGTEVNVAPGTPVLVNADGLTPQGEDFSGMMNGNQGKALVRDAGNGNFQVVPLFAR